MDAEVEVVDGELVAVDLADSEPRGLVRRARGLAANPRLQGAVAATAGMVVGVTTLALMRRVGGPATGRAAAPAPVGPAPAAWPAARPVGPIRPGTYIVHVRPIAGWPSPSPSPSSAQSQ